VKQRVEARAPFGKNTTKTLADAIGAVLQDRVRQDGFSCIGFKESRRPPKNQWGNSEGRRLFPPEQFEA
jgi:hypothetical protein